MKLSKLVLRERIPELGSSSFNPPHWDLTFEAGLVTLVKADDTAATFHVPMGNVVYMRPLDAAPKGAKK